MRSKLISILLIFWLALQGVAAFAMPLCQHQQAGMAVAVQNQVQNQIEPGQIEHCAHVAADTGLQTDADCDHCAGCQFCSMTALPKVLHLDPVVPDMLLQGRAIVSALEFLIYLPYRPPIL